MYFIHLTFFIVHILVLHSNIVLLFNVFLLMPFPRLPRPTIKRRKKCSSMMPLFLRVSGPPVRSGLDIFTQPEETG